MINLIKADIYKETRKKSFKIIMLLLIFVSILSIIIVNKNYKKSDFIYYDKMPFYGEEEYKEINKNESYKEYYERYIIYKEDIYDLNNLVNKDSNTRLTSLLSNSGIYMFIIGVIVIFISFNSFSYDYQKDTLKYVFMSKHKRYKVFLSKLLTQLLISLVLIFVISIILLITSSLLTGENIFNVYKFLLINKKIVKVPYLIYYFGKCFVFIIPFLFMISFSMFISIIFKGGTLGLVISNIVYLFSLLFSEVLFKNGFKFIEYTFLPYLDFTYYENTYTVITNNMFYNINLSYFNSLIYLFLYSLVCILLSIKLLKRDV